MKRSSKPTDSSDKKLYSKKTAKILLSVVSVLSCVLAAIGVLLIKTKFTDVDVFKDFVENHYLLSVILMIFVCAIQAIIALIPGELVEIASGYAFGSVWGALICLTGITLGSIVVIVISRRFGRKLVESLYPKEKIDSLPIINDHKKRNLLTALIFLIPGTPKDLVTYAVGLTDMSIPVYLVIATAARFPSIIISTVGGDALGDSRFIHAVIAFIISAAVSLAGYLLYLRISQNKKEKAKNKQKDDNAPVEKSTD